MTSQMNKQPIV